MTQRAVCQSSNRFTYRTHAAVTITSPLLPPTLDSIYHTPPQLQQYSNYYYPHPLTLCSPAVGA